MRLSYMRSSTVSLLAALMVPTAGQGQDASQLEREVFAAINRVRTEPAAMLPALERQLECFDGMVLRCPGATTGIMTREGPAAIHDAMAFLRSQSPLPALAWADGVRLAARDRVRQPGGVGMGTGPEPGVLLEHYGRWNGRLSENISIGPSSVDGVMASFVVSDGDRTRPYRQALFNPAFRVAGVACGPNASERMLCVVYLVSEFTPNAAAVAASSGDTAPSPGAAAAASPVVKRPQPVPPTRARRLSDDYQPSAFDRALLTETNLARTDPAGYADRLVEMLTCFDGFVVRCPGMDVGVRTREGPAAVREAIAFLRAQRPLPALDWSAGLWGAAFDHVRDQGPTGQTGHTGADGSSMSDRMARYGQWQSTAAENIAYGSGNPMKVVIDLIVDDGVPSRGHRANIFQPRLRVMGGACGPHRQYRVMCTIDYAGGFVDAVVGDATSPERRD